MGDRDDRALVLGEVLLEPAPRTRRRGGWWARPGAAGRAGTAAAAPARHGVLVHLARVLTSAIRPDSLICRMGGDEIAVLLPGCSHQAAVRRTRELHDALKGRPFELADGALLSISISAGVAQVPADARRCTASTPPLTKPSTGPSAPVAGKWPLRQVANARSSRLDARSCWMLVDRPDPAASLRLRLGEFRGDGATAVRSPERVRPDPGHRLPDPVDPRSPGGPHRARAADHGGRGDPDHGRRRSSLHRGVRRRGDAVRAAPDDLPRGPLCGGLRDRAGRDDPGPAPGRPVSCVRGSGHRRGPPRDLHVPAARRGAPARGPRPLPHHTGPVDQLPRWRPPRPWPT